MSQDELKKNYLNILKKFNEAIEDAPWGDSIFLKAVRKKLIELRDQFKQEAHISEADFEALEAAHHPGNTLIHQFAQQQGYTEIFVLLYNTDGTNLSRWEQLVHTIEKQAINRPIYANEASAQAAIRAATHKSNEAYLSVFAKTEDILKPSAEVPKDRQGNPLILLRDRAIQKNNIHYFAHKSGLYYYLKEKLIWQKNVEFL